jgi:hypothetical protein
MQISIGRRAFLKAAGLVLPGMSVISREGFAWSYQGTNPAYSGRFVPDGAQCKIAFVSDHHYWPGHLENWGGGGQITTNCDRRMPDLADVLNEERPDLSIHAGDVISAGGSFFPPREEYEKQLAFADDFYRRLSHPFIPMLGNHETADAHYAAESELQPWIQHFGPPYRHHDLNGWRFLGVNCLLPNPGNRYGRGDDYGNVYGLDPAQLAWLRTSLKEAFSRNLKAVVCTHVPPGAWVNADEFEEAIVSAGCVGAVLCGHTHRNSLTFMGGIPVLIRVANVTSPFGYTIVHLYADGRMIVVQKSQHFPHDDFISSSFQSASPLGSEAERYLTVGGVSRLPLQGLSVLGEEAKAAIVDGHLRLVSRSDRAMVLIDSSKMRNARLTMTAVKAAGERMGGIAFAGQDGTGGIEAAVTSRYSTDGKVYLAANQASGRQILARSWFNIGDNIAYRLSLEARGGRIRASWKNMLDLEAAVDPGTSGQFGFFVDRGMLFVTDLKLEAL